MQQSTQNTKHAIDGTINSPKMLHIPSFIFGIRTKIYSQFIKHMHFILISSTAGYLLLPFPVFADRFIFQYECAATLCVCVCVIASLAPDPSPVEFIGDCWSHQIQVHAVLCHIMSKTFVVMAINCTFQLSFWLLFVAFTSLGFCDCDSITILRIIILKVVTVELFVDTLMCRGLLSDFPIKCFRCRIRY